MNGYDINTDVEKSYPNTGKTVSYVLTVTNTTCSPQGEPKTCLLVNGQYPGPKIEANWGDTVEVMVINEMQDNGTSMHWHGVQQRFTDLEDGAAGITQCPLAPGRQRLYRWQATSDGTSWYHSHMGSQYGDGVFGPMVVNGPASYNYDIDLGTIMINEYYPMTAPQAVWLQTRLGHISAPNYLLNGQNIKLDGSAGKRAQWNFTPGKAHRLRFINSGIASHYKIQIDNHKLIVIMVDFVAIQPYVTDELSIGIGQRYDVIVEANQPVGNYYLRALMSSECSFGDNDGTGTANGIISYNGAPAGLPTTKAGPHSDICIDPALTDLIPMAPKSVDNSTWATANEALEVAIHQISLSNDSFFKWTLDHHSQVTNWNTPSIIQAAQANDTWPADANALVWPNADTWTFGIIQNTFSIPHPMHLHGHDFAILGQGPGTFDAATGMKLLNFDSPPRRDSVQLISSGWTVIAFRTDNPGVWVMHCHIAWHSEGGLSLQYIERPDLIPGLFSSQVLVKGSEFQETCDAWNAWVSGRS